MKRMLVFLLITFVALAWLLFGAWLSLRAYFSTMSRNPKTLSPMRVVAGRKRS